MKTAEITPETPLMYLTVGQVQEVFETVLKRLPQSPQTIPCAKKYYYGINGIMELFDCGRQTANRIKASGDIDKAISQRGRTIVIDGEKALELLKHTKR